MKCTSRLLPALLLALALAVPAVGYAGGKLKAGDLTASAVTHQSALLSGSVEAESGADEPTWRIRYGTAADDLRIATAPRRVPVGTRPGPVTVTSTLVGLPAATQMYARLEVSSEKDTKHGDVVSFATAAAPAATPEPSDPPPAAPPAPEVGASFGARPQQGTVRVRTPGSDRFVDLPAAAPLPLPVGTVVDARAGAIELSAELPGGRVQHGQFGGARFQVRQAADGDGRIDLHLRGRGFGRCGDRTVAAVTARKKPHAVRRIWGKDRGGRFRTHGRDSVTTVRGTEWSVADRCDGTVTRVTEGAVDVRVRRTGRVVRLAAGERFRAPHRG